MSEHHKPTVHQACLDQIGRRISSLEKAIADAQQAAAEDTKSSAGDKYETGREMLKQEINKYNQQLSQARKMRQLFGQIDPQKEQDKIGLGSLVQTNEGWYYFAASLGKIEGLQPSCFALSLISPIGKALLDQKAGAQVSFMQRRITILTIL